MEGSSDYVVKISADASDAISKIENVDKALDDTANHAADLSGSLNESSSLGASLAGQASNMAASLSNAFDYAASMERAFASASAAVEPLGAALAQDFAGTRGIVEDFSAGLTGLQQHLISSQIALDGMGEKIQEAMAGMGADAPRKAVNELISLSNTVEKLNSQYEYQSDKIIDIKIALKDATEQLARLEQTQEGIVADAQKELAMAESRLEEFRDRAQRDIADGFKPSAGVERAIAMLESRIDMLKSGISSGDFGNLPGYSVYAEQTTTLERFIANLQDKLAGEAAAMERTDRQAQLYGARIESISAAQAQAAETTAAASGRFAGMASVLAGIGSKLAAVASSAASFASSLGKVGASGLKNLASMAGRIAGHIKEWSRHTLSAGDAVKSLHKRFTNFFSMMVTRLKRMAITSIFKDISATSGQIAQVSASYNAAVSGMVSSSKAFGAQLVAIMEPVISTVGPAISRLLDMLTAGADRLSQFTARLAGRETYIKASKGVYDYAQAVDGEADSAKKAAKANKEYKASVMSFDELHKLEGMSTDADVSDITGITDSQIKQAQTQATAFNEVADSLRKAWQAGDFGGVGMIAADQVGRAFDWLKDVAGWSTNADKFSEILHGITAAINGFFSNLGADKIGSVLADVANSFINGFSILIHEIDGGQIGQRIGEAVAAFARDVDWVIAGQNLIAGLQFVVDMAAGFLNTDALAQLGAGVASFFAGIAAEFDPSKWGDVLASAVNGIAGFFASAFNPDTFAEIGVKFAEMVNNMFSGLDEGQLADGINNFAKSITSFINNALSHIDWGSIASTLGQLASNLDWGSVFELIGLAALPALLPAVAGLAVKGLAAAAAALGGGIPALIAAAVAAVATALALNWDTVTEWAGKAWEKIKEWGSAIADFFSGVVGGIVDAFKGVVDFVGGIGSSIADGVSAAGSWLGDKWNAAKSFITGGEVQVNAVPESIAASGVMASSASGTGADAYSVMAGLNSSFNSAIAEATNRILAALGQSGDVVLYVDSERLARATVRGLNTADLRQNAAGSVAFI
jgi:hypothetical protein